MCPIPSKSRFHLCRDAFLGRFPGLVFEPTQYGFDLKSGPRVLYKHAIEKPATPNNRVWQWKGLKLLEEFSEKYPEGRVLLEVLTKPSAEHACFLVPVTELWQLIKDEREHLGREKKDTFSVPADDGRQSKRPIVRLIKSHRYADHALKRMFVKPFA